MNKIEKKYKLNRIKEVRATRDELLKCDNVGRQRRLVLELPNTSSIYIISSYHSMCELELNDGFTITNSGDNCIVLCGIAAYRYWLKNT